jgi:hypothetical protein
MILDTTVLFKIDITFKAHPAGPEQASPSPQSRDGHELASRTFTAFQERSPPLAPSSTVSITLVSADTAQSNPSTIWLVTDETADMSISNASDWYTERMRGCDEWSF